MREQEIGTPASQGPHQKKENKRVEGVVSEPVWQSSQGPHQKKENKKVGWSVSQCGSVSVWQFYRLEVLVRCLALETMENYGT